MMSDLETVMVPVPRCCECRVPLPQTRYWRTDLGPVHVPYCVACHDRLVALEQAAQQAEVPR